MNSYMIFMSLAALTIALPGPGVLMTINNAAQRGVQRTAAGIVGISLGVLMVAGLSATGLGVLLTTSATAFLVLKYIGALYLIYLGVKLWRTKSQIPSGSSVSGASVPSCFYEGVLLSLSNPKSIVFFMSIFPQFVDPAKDYLSQLIVLALTFSLLIVIIHALYASLVIMAKARFFKQGSGMLINKISGGLLVSFGIGLAASKN